MSISNNATGLRPGVCTSTSRPTTPYTGQIVYETDTGYLRVWDGSAWDYLSKSQDLDGFPRGLVAAPVTWAANSKTVNTASPSVVLAAFTFNATANRYYKMSWLMDIYQSAAAGVYLHLYINGSFNTAVSFQNSLMWGGSYFYKATATGSLTMTLYGIHNSGSGTSYFGSVHAPQVTVEDAGLV